MEKELYSMIQKYLFFFLELEIVMLGNFGLQNNPLTQN